MSEAKQLVVVVGEFEVDVKSMTRSQILELNARRKIMQKEKDNDDAVQAVQDYMEWVLKDLYPQIVTNFDELPNRELMVLASVTEQYSAAVPIEVIEALVKNA